jgi:hypothetical protein
LSLTPRFSRRSATIAAIDTKKLVLLAWGPCAYRVQGH